MKWYWKVRIYSSNGQYAFAVIETDRCLSSIDAVQDAYRQLTGARMLIEGMCDTPFKQENGFHIIWSEK